jgi:hypothetical protein
MKLFDIYIAYIPWKGGGKNRPVLVLGVDDDWKQAGLNELSYVDTNQGEAPKIPHSLIKNSQIGKLTENDKLRFLEFFNKS